LERSIHGVDRDGDLAIEDNGLGGFREFQEDRVCSGFGDDWGRDGVELCEEAEY